MKNKKVFINNKWQSEDILNLKRENIGHLNTFHEKFIILWDNGYKIWKNRKNEKL